MPKEPDIFDEVVQKLETAQGSLSALRRRRAETSLDPEALRIAREGDPNGQPDKSVGSDPGQPAEAPVIISSTQMSLTMSKTEKALLSAGSLDEIREILGDCKRCKLHSGRTNIVFGAGNPDADLVFVGEGPGAEEDARGIPFVGRAGKLLTKMIEAMGVTREDVFIGNVLKCRAPGNRFPESDEISACEPFLKAQIRVIKPKVICALGNAAIHCLVPTKEGVTKLRGRFLSYEGVRLMPTYHPAFLLRSPKYKKEAWEDLQAIMGELGWKRPGGEK